MKDGHDAALRGATPAPGSRRGIALSFHDREAGAGRRWANHPQRRPSAPAAPERGLRQGTARSVACRCRGSTPSAHPGWFAAPMPEGHSGRPRSMPIPPRPAAARRLRESAEASMTGASICDQRACLTVEGRACDVSFRWKADTSGNSSQLGAQVEPVGLLRPIPQAGMGSLGAICGPGGEGGIRTHGTVARTPHFECGAFDHSATSPHLFGVRGPGAGWSARRLAARRKLA